MITKMFENSEIMFRDHAKLLNQSILVVKLKKIKTTPKNFGVILNL
jgi:hypothetical protein